MFGLADRPRSFGKDEPHMQARAVRPRCLAEVDNLNLGLKLRLAQSVTWNGTRQPIDGAFCDVQDTR